MEESKSANPILILVIGIIITLLGLHIVISANSSYTWIEVKGKIVSTKIVNNSDEKDIEVKYTYSVNGKSYHGHKISFGDNTSMTGQEVDRIYEKFLPSGKIISVYYNPKSPDKAVLEPGNNFGSLWPLIMGVFLLFSSVLGFIDKSKAKKE